MENFNKNKLKLQEYNYFIKNIKLLFNGKNIYLIINKTDHFFRDYIYDRKKVFFKV